MVVASTCRDGALRCDQDATARTVRNLMRTADGYFEFRIDPGRGAAQKATTNHGRCEGRVLP
jgi:hypothetical protein